MSKGFLFLLVIYGLTFQAHANGLVKGFNLTEDGVYPLEVSADSSKSSAAQDAVLEAKRLGANHIVINPRALMVGPYSNELVPIKREGENNRDMTMRLVTFLKWAKKQGMTTQIRPIFFVVKDIVSYATYTTTDADGVEKVWWHGNIEPEDPNIWFDSFKAYHDRYLIIAKLAKVDYYTIGAELYSMTVGIEDVWERYPHGFPKNWLQLLTYVRAKLTDTTKIMYDVNFTDDKASSDGLSASGGEFERWRYRLVDLAVDGPRTEENQSWFNLKDFWNGLDAIGIDMYRSLAAKTDEVPTAYNDLVSFLRVRMDRYADQLDTSMLEIEMTLGKSKPLIFKEIGFRSATKSFIDPFNYDSATDEVNVPHQAAAYQAFLESFFDQEFAWFGGVAFWDIGLNPTRRGMSDSGFTPLGKTQTETIIKKYFNRQ